MLPDLREDLPWPTTACTAMQAASTYLCALLVSLAIGWSCALAQTDSYPSRTITILVPLPPGGSADTVLRPVAQKVSESLKQTIVIDNRSGAGGNVAALATKQAAPDGYTLFLANMGTLAVNPSLYSDLRFDPIKDFQPITPIISFPHILIVPADSPAKSVAELATLAKSKPGGLSFGSQGIGAGGQILGEMFRLRAGAPMVHVPYRGAAPAVTDVMAGRVDFLFTSYISTGEQAQAGKVRILAFAGKKRTERCPRCRPWREAGFPISSTSSGPAWWRLQVLRRRS